MVWEGDIACPLKYERETETFLKMKSFRYILLYLEQLDDNIVVDSAFLYDYFGLVE